MHEKKLILFDYDGVIVDSLRHNVSIAMECGAQLGFESFPPLNAVRNMDHMTFEALGGLMGLTEDETRALTRCIFSLLEIRFENLSVFPGIEQLLKKLSRRHILAIVTTNREAVILNFLGKKGLSQYFSAVSGGNRSGSKSDRAGELMKRFSMTKEKTYLIGDTISDMAEARHAGVKSIAATWGFQSRERLLSENPDFLADSPEEIETIFM